VRNGTLHQALEAFTVDAATRLCSETAGGAEIPFELTEEPGGRVPLYCYRPLTDDFIRPRLALLSALASYTPAARALSALGARAVLVKGGHLSGPEAIDVLAVDGEVIELRARRLSIPATHGTGCTFASLVAGRLAIRRTPDVGREVLVAAVRWAKRRHHAALERTADVGRGLRVVVF